MYMKNLIQENQQEPHLKVIKNSKSKIKNTVKRLCINTLTPRFNFRNSKGEVITPQSYNLL